MKDVCIIVPFRNREEHLKEFAPYMFNFLTNEDISFDILIVEQFDDKPFNRGRLLNIGFNEKKNEYTNFIFHDVDMLPVENKAWYKVVEVPTHYAAIVEQFGWNLAYPKYVGGVTAFTKEPFVKINGFCNEYAGWGAEDDDLMNRCEFNKVTMNRRNNMYCSLSHDRVIVQEQYQRNLELLKNWKSYTYSGLFDLKYNIETTEIFDTYTKIKVK